MARLTHLLVCSFLCVSAAAQPFGYSYDVRGNRTGRSVTEAFFAAGFNDSAEAEAQDSATYRLPRFDFGPDYTKQEREAWAEKMESENPTVTYRGGVQLTPSKELTGISTYDSGTLIVSYTVEHTTEDGVSLLERIRCTCSGGELPPLRFSYGTPAQRRMQGEGDFQSSRSMLLTRYFRTDADDFYYNRGKYAKDEWSDGLAIYPRRSQYQKINWREYGSEYYADQDILLVSKIQPFTSPERIVAGEGFQVLEAADTDGDGIDEFVRVNFSAPDENTTRLTVTRIKYQSPDEDIQWDSFNVDLSGAKIHKPILRGLIGNTIIGSGKGLIYGASNNVSQQFTLNGFDSDLDLKEISKSSRRGALFGGGLGLVNGIVSEAIYQKALKDISNGNSGTISDFVANVSNAMYESNWFSSHLYTTFCKENQVL